MRDTSANVPQPSGLLSANLHHHDHLALGDLTPSSTVSLDPANGLKMMLLDILCGSISGLVNHCVGHPIDFVKIRMQTVKGSRVSALQIIRNTVNSEGVLAFYKGFCPPLATGPLINAVVFCAFEFSRRYLGVKSVEDYTLRQILLCGGFAGFVESFLCTPVDLVKCRLQMQKESKANAYYKGPLDVVRKVIRDEGVKGLYRGQTTMLIREIPLFATQFGTYFYCRKYFAQNVYKCKIDDLPTLPMLFSGGLSGLACWTVAYPLDTVKTRLYNKLLNNFNYLQNDLTSG